MFGLLPNGSHIFCLLPPPLIRVSYHSCLGSPRYCSLISVATLPVGTSSVFYPCPPHPLGIIELAQSFFRPSCSVHFARFLFVSPYFHQTQLGIAHMGPAIHPSPKRGEGFDCLRPKPSDWGVQPPTPSSISPTQASYISFPSVSNTYIISKIHLPSAKDHVILGLVRSPFSSTNLRFLSDLHFSYLPKQSSITNSTHIVHQILLPIKLTSDSGLVRPPAEVYSSASCHAHFSYSLIRHILPLKPTPASAQFFRRPTLSPSSRCQLQLTSIQVPPLHNRFNQTM